MYRLSNHRPSTIDNQTIDHQPSTINHQPSTINHQPSTINHQPSTINYQPSNHRPSNHRPSNHRPSPSTKNHRPKTINQKPSTINQHTMHPSRRHLPFVSSIHHLSTTINRITSGKIFRVGGLIGFWVYCNSTFFV